jgi:hypothetical protein
MTCSIGKERLALTEALALPSGGITGEPHVWADVLQIFVILTGKL